MDATDASLGLQYMALPPNADGTHPAISIAYSHTFPTGRYDGLGANTLNGAGSGASSDSVSLLYQQFFWLPNGRPLRWRWQLSWGASPAPFGVHGASVYGTSAGFLGQMQLGSTTSASTSLEYSLDKHWVLAVDAAWSHEGASLLRDLSCSAGESCSDMNRVDPAGWIYTVAPAIEYNFNSSLGIIAGTEIDFAGHSHDAVLSPQVALNIVF
jgi:hypothetical protein